MPIDKFNQVNYNLKQIKVEYQHTRDNRDMLERIGKCFTHYGPLPSGVITDNIICLRLAIHRILSS